MATGRMIQIDDLIKELQDIRKCYGNTCVYIRDVSWGALALNRKADDDAAEQAGAADRDPGAQPSTIDEDRNH